jgi:hypothetical protein
MSSTRDGANTAAATTDNEVDRHEDSADGPNRRYTGESLEFTAAYGCSPGDKKLVAIKDPQTVTWEQPVSAADVRRLKKGFRSADMSLKWDMLVEDPDKDGGISVLLIHNWARQIFFVLHLLAPTEPGGGTSTRAVTYDPDCRLFMTDAELCKQQVVMLCRRRLHCEFEALPDYPVSIFLSRQTS